MKKTLAITADLGNFNVYLWETASFHRAPRLELINAFENTEAHGQRANTLTVLEKKSAQKASPQHTSSVGSDGEQHHMQLEKRRRLIREMACRIADFLKDPDVERCFLAVSREINHQLVESIAPDLRGKIEKNLALNLTRLDVPEIIEHFSDHAVHSR